MLVTFPLLLLLFSGGHALVPFVDKFIQGSSEDNDGSEDRSIEPAQKDTAETLREILYGTVGSRMRHETRKHFVQHPKDDEDLDLVMNFLRDGSYNKTGQLRFNSVAVVESDLVKDLLNVIYSRAEYLQLLNNPVKAVMTEVIKEMIRVPTQHVLQQQLFHKIVAERAWKTKFIDPMMQDNKRNTLLNFGRHLLEAKRNETLSTEDITDFHAQLENIAFFDREDDKLFQQMVDNLIQAFGESVNQTQDNDSIVRSNEQAAKNLNTHRHGFDLRTTGLYRTTTVAPTTTTRTAQDSTTAEYASSSRYPFTSDARFETTTDSYGTSEVEDYSTTSGYEPTTSSFAKHKKNGPIKSFQGESKAALGSADYQGCEPDCDPVPPEHEKFQGKSKTALGSADYQGCEPDCDPVPPEHEKFQGKSKTTLGSADYQGCEPDCNPVPPEHEKFQGKSKTTLGSADYQGCEPDCNPVPPEHEKFQGKSKAALGSADYQGCEPDCDPVPPEHKKFQGKSKTALGSADYQGCEPDCDPVPPEHKNAPINKHLTDSDISNANKTSAGIPNSSKSNQTERQNSSGKLSTIVKDTATENPIVYVQGVSGNVGDESFGSGNQKGSIKKTENNNPINSNETNKTSTGESVGNLGRSPYNSHKG